VLPDPAQHAVAKVVSAATPFSFPDKASDKAGHGRTVSTDATGASDGVRGVDGQAVSDAKTPPGTPAGGPATTAANGVGANTGATGLDRANETPAAGNAPTSVPGNGGPPVTPGKGANGQDMADSTPAPAKGTTTVPAPGPPATPGATNRGTTPTTPAADRPGATVRP
jgi:hypothetical protein